MPPVKVLIADDHTLMRQGLRQICEGMGGFQVVAEASDCAQAVDLACVAKPDVILMDVVLPAASPSDGAYSPPGAPEGIDAIRQILEVEPKARVIAITMYREEQYMLGAIRAGARGFLLKTASAAELISAIRAAAQGDYLIDPVVAARVLSELHLPSAAQSRPEPLTGAEMAVLRLVAHGLDNQEIAGSLHYSVHTVANRLRTIYEKLGVTNRTQAALYALRQGWATLNEQ